MMKLSGLLVLVGVCSSALFSSSASACSAPECGGAIRFGIPADALVPENLGELTVYGDTDFAYASGYALRVWEEDNPDAVIFSGKIAAADRKASVALDAQLSAGKRYVVEATPSCSFSGEAEPVSIPLEVGPAHEPPSSLGPLRIVRSGRATVPVGGDASCYSDYDASLVDLKLDPTHLPEAWRDLLTHYQLMVDGEPFSWRLTIGDLDAFGPKDAARGFFFSQPGTFEAWTPCEDSAYLDKLGLSPGKHELWVEARVPSSEPTTIASEHVEVDLRCSARPAKESSESSEKDGPSAPTTDDGCSLAGRAGGESGAASALWIAAALAFGSRRRRSR
jgi:hypothetical protein